MGEKKAPRTISISPAGAAFYRALKAEIERPTKRTQNLLIDLDEQITQVHDMGAPTSALTDALDALWDHLIAQKFAVPLTDLELQQRRAS